MGKVKDDNYYVVQAWMVTKLKLKGLEKDLFAIIYGFSQDEESDFHGSLDYLSQLTGYSRNSICIALAHLTELNYLEKTVTNKNNDAITRCSYIVNREIINTHDIPKNLDGKADSGPKNLDGHGPKNLDGKALKAADYGPNFLDVYIKANKDIKIKKDKKKNSSSPLINPLKQSHKEQNALTIASLYNEICTNLSKVRVLNDNHINAIDNLLKDYSIDDFKEAFQIANDTPFLLGDNDRGWKANFNFMLREDKLLKVLEGDYGSTKVKDIGMLPNNRGVVSTERTEESKQRVREFIEDLKARGEQYEY